MNTTNKIYWNQTQGLCVCKRLFLHKENQEVSELCEQA
jgi:hypothetical protein